MKFNEVYKNKKVLVTGDTGFKGSWLCEWLLREGAEVYGIALPPNTTPALFDQLGLAARIHHLDLDIRDQDAFRMRVGEIQPDVIFHLAAQPLVRLSYETPVETFDTNVMGTVHLLDAVRNLSNEGHSCAVVCITTDKCYQNREWLHAYREKDPMGGHDPYSASKGACELAIQSYRDSFFHTPSDCGIAVASARAGNVIGGGDWALDRIVPDCVRALAMGESIPVRNRIATRPWQHVLEPLGGYLLLAAELRRGLDGKNAIQANFHYQDLCGAFNFGPALSSNRTVQQLVEEVLKHWPGHWEDKSDPNAVHEASLLNLATDKAYHMLGWQPIWGFEETIERTILWSKQAHEGTEVRKLVDRDLATYAGRY